MGDMCSKVVVAKQMASVTLEQQASARSNSTKEAAAWDEAPQGPWASVDDATFQNCDAVALNLGRAPRGREVLSPKEAEGAGKHGRKVRCAHAPLRQSMASFGALGQRFFVHKMPFATRSWPCSAELVSAWCFKRLLGNGVDGRGRMSAASFFKLQRTRP